MCFPLKICEIWQDGNADEKTIKEKKTSKVSEQTWTLAFCVLVLSSCHCNILFDRIILDWINV